MFQRLLAMIGRRLTETGIPYMVIGGQAVLLYGEPRLTRDIDITLGAALDRLKDVVALAKDMGLLPLADPETFARRTMVLPCQEPDSGIRVDFIFSHSLYEQQAIARARAIEMQGVAVMFASPEDLVVHKVIAGRPRDLEDARIVLMKHPEMDISYIRKWVKEFETALGEQLVQRLDHIAKDAR